MPGAREHVLLNILLLMPLITSASVYNLQELRGDQDYVDNGDIEMAPGMGDLSLRHNSKFFIGYPAALVLVGHVWSKLIRTTSTMGTQ